MGPLRLMLWLLAGDPLLKRLARDERLDVDVFCLADTMRALKEGESQQLATDLVRLSRPLAARAP